MLLTLRAALREAAARPVISAGDVAAAAARGALMGARGNSGVILSQYLRGLAAGLDGQSVVDAPAFAHALAAASDAASAAVACPAEGTILTVARDSARAAGRAADDSVHSTCRLNAVLGAAAAEARQAVQRTPEQLPILREAGVVDAGGAGLAAILEGMDLTLRGEALPEGEAAEANPPAALQIAPAAYGYCTEFLLRGDRIDLAALRVAMSALGDSLLVVGDESLARVHLHTFHPGQAIDAALPHGAVDQVKIEDMQRQNDELRGRGPLATSSLVVVASGTGFVSLFRSLGAGAVVPGGPTMNPSAEEIARAIDTAHATECVVLLNNRNVLLAAEQARALARRPTAIVPTRDQAEGVAAALAFDPGKPAIANQTAMEQATRAVRTGAVTVAARATRIDGKPIPKGAVLGLVEDRIAAVDADIDSVVLDVLGGLRGREAEIITLYPGADVAPDASERLSRRVRQEFPGQQVDLVPGGQPHYPYLLACE